MTTTSGKRYMSKYLQVACRNTQSCRTLLQNHGWAVYWVDNPYMYLVLDFHSQTTYVRSTLKPEITLLVYPESLAQLLVVEGDARDILIEEFYREQRENHNG